MTDGRLNPPPLLPVADQRNSSRRRYAIALIVIQIILTAFALMALVAQFQMGVRVHHTVHHERKEAEERAQRFNQILKYAVFVPWLLFTAAHVGVRLGWNLQHRLKGIERDAG